MPQCPIAGDANASEAKYCSSLIQCKTVRKRACMQRTLRRYEARWRRTGRSLQSVSASSRRPTVSVQMKILSATVSASFRSLPSATSFGSWSWIAQDSTPKSCASWRGWIRTVRTPRTSPNKDDSSSAFTSRTLPSQSLNSRPETLVRIAKWLRRFLTKF